MGESASSVTASAVLFFCASYFSAGVGASCARAGPATAAPTKMASAASVRTPGPYTARERGAASLHRGALLDQELVEAVQLHEPRARELQIQDHVGGHGDDAGEHDHVQDAGRTTPPGHPDPREEGAGQR